MESSKVILLDEQIIIVMVQILRCYIQKKHFMQIF